MTIEKIEKVDIGLGNTKTNPKKQVQNKNRWCFTLNNGIEKIEKIFTYLTMEDKCIIGREVGASGTPHLQGYIHFKKRCRPMSRIPIKEIHWESCKGNEKANVLYCSKDNDYEIFNNSLVVPRRRRQLEILEEDKLYNWELKVKEILETEPDDRSIYWFSDLGKCNSGKTTFCKYLSIKYEAICLSGKVADMKNGIVMFKKINKETPDIILINLPKTFDCNYLSYTGIETIKDMFFYSGKYEGGMICGACPHLIIFSNELPDVDKTDPLRWKIYDITTDAYMSLTDVIAWRKEKDSNEECFC